MCFLLCRGRAGIDWDHLWSSLATENIKLISAEKTVQCRQICFKETFVRWTAILSEFKNTFLVEIQIFSCTGRNDKKIRGETNNTAKTWIFLPDVRPGLARVLSPIPAKTNTIALNSDKTSLNLVGFDFIMLLWSLADSLTGKSYGVVSSQRKGRDIEHLVSDESDSRDLYLL